jgi:hypothetical protein
VVCCETVVGSVAEMAPVTRGGSFLCKRGVHAGNSILQGLAHPDGTAVVILISMGLQDKFSSILSSALVSLV